MRVRNPARLIPFIAIALVLVLTTDLIVLLQKPVPQQQPQSQAQRPTRHRPQPTQSLVAESRVTEPVAPLGQLHKPNLFVITRSPFTTPLLRKAAKLRGVRALELADAASITLDGKRVQTLAVNPSTFRAYTPKVTASSDALWANVAAGDVAVSFVLGNDGGLSLHRKVAGPVGELRIGAYATTGFGAIDAVVSKDTGRRMGIPHDNALIVSAPDADSGRLRAKLLRVLPKGTQVGMVNPVLPAPEQIQQNWPVGSFMSTEQITVALRAGASKVGRPYVWGAEGPESFDCSGLVQWAFGQAGVRMPRVTDQQWMTGPRIALKDAQPGDLIFWRLDPTNPGYISHVAIYWGGGKMLVAPRTGDVVKIAPVSTRGFAGVVRVSPAAAARVR
ncbi:MAG: C40 family peptidase [Nonomuraea sp.]|nr:C40 family peptidase [Nonomuraea sp.]